jgi:hypothetical protein
MDVLSRLVTKSQKKRNLSAIVFLWIVFLGFTFLTPQKGEAIGNENGQTALMNNNSPEFTLRGIEFNDEALLDTGGPDNYGYQWDNSVSYGWKDPTGATPVTLSHPDFGFAGPIDMGFAQPFPFYENTYSQVYISANGFLSFLSLKQSIGYDANEEIPNDLEPNSIVAPFWSDLAVGGSYNSGIVSTMQGSDSNGEFFAVNFVGVSKSLSPSDLLTFQIILYQNGDIWFQYNSLAGSLASTVGIEDGDGLDGLDYPLAPQNSLAIRFQRPGDTARIKVFPAYQSGFTQGGVADFYVQIRNTGELGSDTYNLTTEAIENPAWLITLWKEDGSGGLTDTNDDDIVDTGVVSEGETKTILVRLQSPSGAAIGDYSTFVVTATSLLDAGKNSDTVFQAAIPAGHFIAFGNSAGLDLGRVTPAGKPLFDVTGAGKNPSLILAKNQYFYAWEYDYFNIPTNSTHSDIEYTVLTYNGQAIRPVTKLTDNASADLQTIDGFSALAVTPNNHIGIIWLRHLFDPSTLGHNYNIYFAILDQNGEVLVPPSNVTNNTLWQDGNDINVPVYSSPTILATSDNRLILPGLMSAFRKLGLLQI